MDHSMIEFLNGPEFLSLSSEKQKFLREMVVLMDGRPMNEKVQILLSYGFRMQNQGLTLSREESAMLMRVLQENLTPEERQRFDQISRML